MSDMPPSMTPARILVVHALATALHTTRIPVNLVFMAKVTLVISSSMDTSELHRTVLNLA